MLTRTHAHTHTRDHRRSGYGNLEFAFPGFSRRGRWVVCCSAFIVSFLRPGLASADVEPRVTPCTVVATDQRHLTGNTVSVRIDPTSWAGTTQAARLNEWKFLIQWAIQRWNEASDSKPRLVWDDTPAARVTPAQGQNIVNIWFDSGSGGVGAIASASVFPACPGGASWGGSIKFYQNMALPPGGSVGILWSTKLSASGGACVDTNGTSGTCVHEATLHELGHILGLGHTCENVTGSPLPCNCNTGASAPHWQIMRGAACGAFAFQDAHGPRAEDSTNAHAANGTQLQRLQTTLLRYSTTNDWASWTSGGNENLGTYVATSGVDLAGNGFASDKYLLAWRDYSSNQLRTAIGTPGGWAAYLTHSGRGVLNQPRVASDGAGNWLVVAMGRDVSDPVTNDRQIFNLMRSNGVVSAFQAASPYQSTADAPSVSFVGRPVAAGGFWVMAYHDRNTPTLKIATAPRTSTPVTPTWSVYTATYAGQNLSSWGSTSLACNPSSASSGTDVGRCLLGFGTLGHRTDEGLDQPGTLRTASFSVNTSGVPSSISMVSFSSYNRTATATGMTFNRTNLTWHMGVTHPDSSCLFRLKMTAGQSSWPASTCFALAPGGNVPTSASLARSEVRNETVYYFGNN